MAKTLLQGSDNNATPSRKVNERAVLIAQGCCLAKTEEPVGVGHERVELRDLHLPGDRRREPVRRGLRERYFAPFNSGREAHREARADEPDRTVLDVTALLALSDTHLVTVNHRA